MQNLAVLILHALLFLGTESAAMIHNLKSSPPVIPLNSTLQVDRDPRFAMQPHYTTTPLPATAILMNTVELLSNAAFYLWDAHIDYDHHEIFTYPAVFIDLQITRSRDPIATFMFVWALYEAAWDMVAKKKFCTSRFDILWKERIVAKLIYRQPHPEEPLQANSETLGLTSNESASVADDVYRKTLTINTALSTLHLGGAPTTPPRALNASYEDVRLEVKYLLNAQDLPIGTMFLAVLAALKDNAYFPAEGM